MFAELAKLQPFQDGNKRTALIAANAANGSLETGDYLILPTLDLDRAEFIIDLMRYYVSDDAGRDSQLLNQMIKLVPDKQARFHEFNQPVTPEQDQTAGIRNVKLQFRDPD